jgi:hypothetical protein
MKRNIYDTDQIEMFCQRNEKLLFILLIVVALLIRMFRLGVYPFWGDEADSLYMAVNQIYFHPHLYPLLLQLWNQWASNEFTYRLLSALIGVGAIAATWFLARRLLKSSYAAFLATLFLTLSPSHVYYSRELRMYSLFTLTAALSWLAFFRWMKRDNTTNTLLVIAAGSAVLYTHKYGVIFLAAQCLAVFFMVPFKHAFKRLVIYVVPVIIIFIPYLRLMLYYLRQFMGAQFWAQAVSLQTPRYLLRFILAGYNASENVTTILIVAGLVLMLKGCATRKNSEYRLLVVFGLLAPILMAVLISVILPSSLLVARYVIFVLVPVAIVLAAGTHSIKTPIALLVPLVLLAGQVQSITLQYRNIFRAQAIEVRERKEFRQACQVILDNCAEGDVIGTTTMSGTHPVWYYITYKHGYPLARMVDVNNYHRHHLARKYNHNEFLEEVYVIANPINIDELIEVGRYKRFWFYGTQWNEGSNPEDFYYAQRTRIRNWLQERYPELGVWEFRDIDVRLFDLENPIINSDAGDESSSD